MTEEIQRWADPAMFSAEPMDGTTPKVFLISATPDPLGALAAACMMYEGKVCRDRSEISDEMRRHYWAESQKTHLRAPHEFIDFHFMIEGVTRAFTHQLVRQRTAVYAQESLRFAVKESLSQEVALPPSIREESEAETIWQDTIETIEDAYNVLINRLKIPAEDARGLLPMNVTTRVHYKTNLRNLVEHAGNRLCTQAQFEWRQVFNEIVRSIQSHTSHPSAIEARLCDNWQWDLIAASDLFRPVCYAQGKCPFNADFDRGCTIRPRVEEGKFNEIDPREWLLDPAAARKGVG
jgi:flavin-dependent thymidylate synthase